MSLRLDGIGRQYGRRTVLRDIDFELRRDETALLRGANGSGKTTLLRIAATILRPTSGTVAIAGDTGAAARRHLAFVPHDAPVYRELTPLEHVRFAADLHGRALGRGDALVALRDAGLAPQAHRPAHVLSRGQRQRLALASALATQAPYLLLDEPFTALDDDATAWAVDAIQSHDGAVLAAVHGATALAADRVLQLDGGRLQ